jgi:mevalonate kinase
LLSGEYFVLDGAPSIALPTTLGQSLKVNYSASYDTPYLKWISYDYNGEKWFEANFEFWHFDFIERENEHGELVLFNEKIAVLQNILRAVRSLNPHFLRDNLQVDVETRLGFPLDWGLGSSSSLVYNIAQWANVSPFELLFKTFGGSGYDIACAQANAPILYQKKEGVPTWQHISFDPSFKESLFFIYLGKKKNSREAIKYYRSLGGQVYNYLGQVEELTELFLHAQKLEEFEKVIDRHEQLLSEALSLAPVKEREFSDFWGSIKSLGAWGGDFILVTSDRSQQETREYFAQRGKNVFIPYSTLIDQQSSQSEATCLQ